MMKLISKFFGYASDEKGKETGGFSEFFTNTGSAEKKKIIREVIKKSNDDQKELVKQYDRKYSSV